MDLGLSGLRVLVTAGATGIGLATAEAFLREGASVHVCDVDEAGLAKLRDRMGTTVCDVSDPRAVARLFEEAQSSLGGLDALVNNAGVAGPTAPCENVALGDWERTLAVNLTGQFLCAQRAIPLLKASANGSVANLSSAAGRFGFPGRTPYAASKWGVIGLTKSLSMELGAFGIRANAILPGPVAGERMNRVLEARAAAGGRSLDEERASALVNQSLKSFTEPGEIAALALFLASDGAKTISGQALAIDGDMHRSV